jgi:hypothetical protein
MHTHDDANIFLTVGRNTEIIIQYVGGDLAIEEGEEEGIVTLISEGTSARYNEAENKAFIRTDEDCAIFIPPGASVSVREVNGDLVALQLRCPLNIEQADGDLTIRDLSGPLNIKELNGDGKISDVNGPINIIETQGELVLRNINGPVNVQTANGDLRVIDINGPVVVGEVSGDFVARDITGPLTVSEIDGDAEIKRVNGPVQVGSVAGDANFREVNGPLGTGTIGGDAAINTVSSAIHVESVEGSLVFEAVIDNQVPGHIGAVGNDVTGKVGNDANARITIPAKTSRRINVSNAQVLSQGDYVTILLGGANEGGTSFYIERIGGEFELNGQSRVSGFNLGKILPDNFDEMINKQVRDQMERVQAKIAQQMERVEIEVNKAERKAKRRGFNIDFDFDFGGRKSSPVPPIPPIPPMPPAPPSMSRAERPAQRAEPVSDKERLAILRMVENKQISVEAAEKLLAALEGRLDE